jgi:methylmalonyl-CoA mutase
VAGFDLVIVETSGIGQGDAAIVPHVDVPLYVMTPEFGAASQLEKIDMLDFADFVAINKFDRKGAADALRDVAKQVQRNREAWSRAHRTDAGVRHHGRALQRRRRDRARTRPLEERLAEFGVQAASRALAAWWRCAQSANQTPVVPPARARYLAEISRHRARLPSQRPCPGAAWRARSSSCAPPPPCWRWAKPAKARAADAARDLAAQRECAARRALRAKLLASWPEHATGLRRRRIRGQDARQGNPHRADHHFAVVARRSAKSALPTYQDHGETSCDG